MLDADMNARYWKYLVQRYSRRDKVLKIFLAIMASGTVAGWGLWESFPYLWKTLSAISALVAISLPILNYQKSIEQMASLAGKWGELRIEYEDLWRQVNNTDVPKSIERVFKKFRKIESGLQEKETTLPDDRKLLLRCFEEVKQARGINRG
jgi:hypothetical protein